MPLNSKDETLLRRALRLATQAAGGVSPRPPVGAVIAKDGEPVGEGFTEPRPGRHAEMVAIERAGERASRATMYCTLEPHAHQGVAPPCTEEIIKAGISRLVCPIEDPNPKVNGNGFRMLRSAGVEVVTEVPPEAKHEAIDLVSGFAMLVLRGRPFITVKYAMSLDGKIATKTGDSQWITGKEARSESHEMRRMSDVLITGIGTVLADNPRMTARDSNGDPTGRPNLRVVVDTKGRLPVDAALLQEAGDVLWVRGEGAKDSHARAGVETVDLPVKNGHVDIDKLVNLLGEREISTAMLESGGALAGAFLEANKVDRVAAFVAPVVIGGEEAPGPIGGIGSDQMDGVIRLENVRTKLLGDDMLVTGYRSTHNE